MIDDQESFSRCNTDNNITFRDSLGSFFKSKTKPINIINKFYSTLANLPSSFSHELRLADKNSEYHITPYFISNKSIAGDFAKLESVLNKCNSLYISNEPEVILFNTLPEFQVELPIELKKYTLPGTAVANTLRKTRTFKRMHSTKRATFKVKEDDDDEYLGLKRIKTGSSLSCRYGCNIVILYLDMRKTSLLSVITETIDTGELELYRENIFEQIKEDMTNILTSSPLKPNYESEIKILFSFRPARIEFAQMVFQDKFKTVNFKNNF
jgi:hypothetical protein